MRRIPENREEYFDARNDAYFMPDTYRQGWGQITGQKTRLVPNLMYPEAKKVLASNSVSVDDKCLRKSTEKLTADPTEPTGTRTIIRIPK
jgi:hypothetical protein